MTILLDADSLVYSCCYGVESAEEAKDKLDSYIHNIIASIEEVHGTADNIEIYHGQDQKNFRKDIVDTYKANRSPVKPDFFSEVSDYIKFFFDALTAPNGLEVDDVVSMRWKELTNQGEFCIIAAIDKDYLQLPATIYSWAGKRIGFTEVSEEDAMRNFWTQMIVGDSSDNVNYIKGKGIKFSEKYLEDADSWFKYISRVYRLFKEEYGDDAKEKFLECYRLLKIG